MTGDRFAVGVDWAGDGWVAVTIRDGRYAGIRLEPSVADLWAGFEEEPAVVLVDVPIGLFDETDDEAGQERGRACDRVAREVLGDRRSSVFTPPARQAAQLVAEGADHGEVSAQNRALVGKGLSIQAYHIAEGIVAVDQFLRDESAPDYERRRATIAEAHPEVCFTALERATLSHSKTTAAGLGERLSALEAVLEDPSGLLHAACTDLTAGSPAQSIDAVGPDDVLDAICLAAAGSGPESERHRLPPEPPTDAYGLPMEMVYRAQAPFGTEGPPVGR